MDIFGFGNAVKIIGHCLHYLRCLWLGIYCTCHFVSYIHYILDCVWLCHDADMQVFYHVLFLILCGTNRIC